MLHFNLPFLRERFIFFTIIVTGMLGILFYCLQLHPTATCRYKGIEIKSKYVYNVNVYTINDTLHLFLNGNQKSDHLFWILPDHSYASGSSIIKSFHHIGIQDIQVLTGNCHFHQRITIQPAIVTTKDTISIYPSITGPSTATVGIEATFSSNQPTITGFAWQLTGREDSIHHTPTVTYTFRTPGEKILTLIINRDTARMAVKHIHVFPPPIPISPPIPAIPLPPTHPPVKKAEPSMPVITEEEFKFMLQQVISGYKQCTDFSEYLCNNLLIPVIINEKTMIPFNQFCLQITGRKRLSLDQVKMTRDKSGCITTLSVHYNKKRFIGLF
ncbi:MAG: hypothetical protein JO154_11565 [Chitinophaga sp.]|uniref:hypothetical protein n=1 Tax=Chitinophaga sp. TaxID=1869181 RepID=UPI0025C54F91|nr:hypothetical protein [Chitinophaga sp.]MBV8253235.1 hypothetical protein [Chitinophaga sp.]